MNPPIPQLGNSATIGGVKPFKDVRLGEDLLWRDLRVAPFPRPVPALFLDRDGVIIQEKEYISSPDQVELLPGIVELIRAARYAGMAVAEVTNQAAIAHGYCGWQEYVQVENRMTELLAGQNVRLDAVLACPFHPQGLGPYGAANHPWRKPNPGMLYEAAKLLNLTLTESVMIGDKASDQRAACQAQLALGIHVLTGHGEREQELARAVAAGSFTVHVVSRADEAVPLLERLAKTAGLRT